MLKQKTVNIYGFFAIGTMLVMLVLIWARLVPQSMYTSMFLVALALFLVRVTLRLTLARQQREARARAEAGGAANAGEKGAEEQPEKER
jgi:uncharacterized membrane protein